MKKIMVFFLLVLIVMSGCSNNKAASERNDLNLQSSSSLSRAAWTIEDMMENEPYTFEGTCLSKEPLPENGASELLEIRVDKVYQGDLTENVTIQLRTMQSSLFPVGKCFLIFAEAGASVFSDSEYLISNASLYSEGDSVNDGIFIDTDDLSYEEVICKVEEYVMTHQGVKEIDVQGAFCKSEEINEIYEFSDFVLEVEPYEILIDGNDRTTYNCNVINTIKGQTNNTVTVIVFKNAMEIGQKYVLMLTKPSPESGVYIVSSNKSVMLAGSLEAEQIVSYK